MSQAKTKAAIITPTITAKAKLCNTAGGDFIAGHGATAVADTFIAKSQKATFSTTHVVSHFIKQSV